ncbi:hypothetical protein [Vineibacter terrae]|uniref:hypothetical protein n=1 Tax=Vineibacter terrae TaxID=2586908 RepID=UPI002E3014E6|nr:hypothetical protein [Vineibacter terrae]HEX2891120.1 hypothetical protein [Vineibacter terrae]
MGERTPSPAMAAAPSRSGLWRDSRGVYVLGSLAATLLEALVLIIAVWPASAGWGGGVLLALMLLGTAAALVLAPLASWIAWSATPPMAAALRRWLQLTAIASLVSLVVLVLVLSALRAADLWLWYAAPVAGLHAWWSGLFLLGRRR